MLYDINYRQFMPRLGIVYRLGHSTVVCVAAGLMYSPEQTNNLNILNLNPPFSGSTVYQNDPAHPIATISNPFAGVPVGGGPAALVMLGHLNPSDGNRSMFLNNKIWQWTVSAPRENVLFCQVEMSYRLLACKLPFPSCCIVCIAASR